MKHSIRVVALAVCLGLALFAMAASADDLVDPRGTWKVGNDVLKFTGKDMKRGRYSVEVDYMGMRVSSRGRWIQPKAGIIVWKLTDINIGGQPGEFFMLPEAGDYMFGIFARDSEDQLRMHYEMKGYSSKNKDNWPKPDALEKAKAYKKG